MATGTAILGGIAGLRTLTRLSAGLLLGLVAAGLGATAQESGRSAAYEDPAAAGRRDRAIGILTWAETVTARHLGRDLHPAAISFLFAALHDGSWLEVPSLDVTIVVLIEDQTAVPGDPARQDRPPDVDALVQQRYIDGLAFTVHEYSKPSPPT